MSCQNVTLENVEKFVSGFDTVLTDCDGVLWHGTNATPGAADTLQKLQQMGKKIFYLTNNSSKSRDEYVAKCTEMGMPASKESIIGSAYVAAQYIRHQIKYTGKVYIIGSTGIQRELEEVGISCIGVGPGEKEDLSYDEMTNIMKTELDPEVKCVVVGLDKYFNYMKLARAISYLARDGCHFVVTNTDSALPTGGGTYLPGTGALVAAVETAASRKADIYCGKPYPPMFDILSKTHDVQPQRTIMIGDRLNTDIELAGRCGLQSLLVLTGFSTLEEVKQRKMGTTLEDKQQIPQYYIQSIGELGTLMNAAGL